MKAAMAVIPANLANLAPKPPEPRRDIVSNSQSFSFVGFEWCRFNPCATPQQAYRW